MRRFAWTRILSVLLVLCMVASVVSMGVPAALAERVTVGSDTLEYFPVTLYNYDAEKMNQATHKVEYDANNAITTWNGLYFSGGDPASTYHPYATGNVTSIENGYKLVVPEFDSNGYITNLDTTKEYIFVSKRGAQAIYDNNSSNSSSFKRTAVEGAGSAAFAYTNNVTEWTLTESGDGYRIRSNRSSSSSYYMVIGSGTGYSSRNSTAVTYIMSYEGDSNCVVLNQSYYYLNHYGGNDGTTFAGYTSRTDEGAAFYIYEVATNIEAEDYVSLPYAGQNHWGKGFENDNRYGQMIYSGLVQSQLDANKDIVFNVPDAGLFSDAAVDGKTIYTGAQIPFVYDNTTKYYTFDSAIHGVYWHADSTQGTSSTIASNTKLYWDKGNPQEFTDGVTFGDGSENLWAPFDDGDPSSSSVDYYFGMNATIPFTMTANGRLNASNNESDPIEFSFSGDDDVWIFVDGTLVADLGGIHNRLDVTINFATNEVTYFISEDNTAAYNYAKLPISDGNGYADDKTTGNLFTEANGFTTKSNIDGSNGRDGYTTKLFNEGETTGLLKTDLTSFAAKDNHELTIFYMERGGGSSNARIKFNLPVKDTVSVKKVVDEQLKVTYTDGVASTERTALSAEYQEVVNNLNFGFTILKDGKPLANTTYNLLNANGQVVANPSTDANGHFYLKNGQTAKFTGEFTSEESGETYGETYQVLEDIKDGFIYTEFSATASDKVTIAPALTTNAYSYYEKTADGMYVVTDKDYNGGAAGKLYSTAYTVSGTAESEDSLAFVCENLLNASLPTPSAIPNDDRVVIDYGLDVVVNLYANDLTIGQTSAISFPKYTANDDGVYTANYGTFKYDADTKSIIYTLNKQLTGVEVIEYTLTSTAEGADDATGTAKVYIMPATSMYYEENFTGLVVFNDKDTAADWKQEGTPETDPQEPGVVETPNDSPYGSDDAYKSDSSDSNGSSWYVDTSEKPAQFTYTFTGTGTSFYARTNGNTGYMRIRIYAANGDMVYFGYRDTVYNDKNGVDAEGTAGTLYNVPVFTWNITDGDSAIESEADKNDTAELTYGTYTVQVTIAAKTTTTNEDGKEVVLYHNEFWLDGIRVYEPLNTNDANVNEALTAYGRDEEANMTVVTLRDKIICESDYNEDGELVYNNGNFVLFTDTSVSDGTTDFVTEYESKGPKEEVYLFDGQSISFSLIDWDPNTYKIYLGVKAPTGNGTVEIGSHQLTLANAADCYYDITEYGTISTTKVTEDGKERTATVVTFDITAVDSLISLTNIKVTGDGEVAFTIIKDVDINFSGSTGSN